MAQNVLVHFECSAHAKPHKIGAIPISIKLQIYTSTLLDYSGRGKKKRQTRLIHQLIYQ